MSTFKWQWWPIHRYSSWEAKRQGRLDGQKNIPVWQNRDQLSYIMELVKAAENDIRLLTQEWLRRDDMLTRKIQDAEICKKEWDEKVSQAKEDLKRAEDDYKRVHGTPPPVGTNARFLWYWLLIAFLFIFEFPINAIVFRLFEEARVFTYVATVAITIALLASAHQLGHFLHKGKCDKTRIGIAVALVIAPILVIVAVTWLRQQYLLQVADETGKSWFRGTFFAFATFNLIIFIVATVASYQVYNPLLFAAYWARKRLARVQTKFAHAEAQYLKAETKRWRTKDFYRTKAHQIKDTVQNLMHLYRKVNLRRRPDRKEYEQQGPLKPKSFEKENQPEIKIPFEKEQEVKEGEV